MTEDEKTTRDRLGALVVMLSLCVAILLIICLSGIGELAKFKREAILNGYAEYKTDENEKTTFNWKIGK